MPVTLSIVNHAATAWKGPRVERLEDFMEQASPTDYRRCKRIIQTSLDTDLLQKNHITPSENGFVYSACHAYSQHHHLTIRPEDVWFAILTQISFFINANAEDLRSFFVEHDGQKELRIKMVGTLETVDFGDFAQLMTRLITKHVKDSELGDWVMPSFSTTTDTDRVVASVLFMGAMQKYFTYFCDIHCGIPSVTLLGEVSDWQTILNKLPMLERLGDEPTQFVEMLRPILNNMIRSFQEPEDAEVVRFWNTIATHNVMGSGTDYYTGWITAFCFWDTKGKAKYRSSRNNVSGVSYPTVPVDEIPVGFARVPVKIDNHGKIISSNMVAGSFGIQAMTINQETATRGMFSTDSLPAMQTNDVPGSQQGESEVSTSDSELTRIQPFSGWVIYESQAEQPTNARKERGCFAPPVRPRERIARVKAEVSEQTISPTGLSTQPLRSRRKINMDKFNLDEDEDEFDFDEEIAV
ncbi:uncharacterized protein FIESC28_02345 [Fusarium coffeatum]|uniref:DUF4419 domain-containing protein n=1 Tax=Fusarium coffeatum TaxID=231269 RepID=A0A366S8A2_9HYPO|nr:uncharacterized protein FIESC28_02345 [Fusarium coffeatum]RBR24855.1 hypothetical protein FIESC28_02345 [Fusarium coffeatum]